MRERALLLAFRQALIITLGAIEEYLAMERSIVPKHKGEQLTPPDRHIT